MNNRILIIATALVSVVVILLGWIIGVSPKLAETAANELERSGVESQNLVLEAELAALIEQFEGIDEIKERIETLRLSLPPGAELPRFIRQLNGLAVGSGVAISNLTTSAALPYTPAAPVAPAPAAEGETPVDGEAVVPDPAVTDGLPLVTSSLVNATNFIAIPVTIVTSGSYEGTLAFLKGLQSGERLLLVTNLAVNSALIDEVLTYEATITGYIYVLVDPTYDPPLEGDVNGDGVVDDADVVEVEVVEPTIEEEPLDGEPSGTPSGEPSGEPSPDSQ